MSRDESIARAMSEIAVDGVTDPEEPWLKIKAKMEAQKALLKRVRQRTVRAVLAGLGVLLVGATAVYAYTRLMSDHGLETADQNGLISNFDRTAMPTVFAAIPPQLATNPQASQKQNGVTITLDWAYMDAYRLALQLTLTGLHIPQGADWNDFICDPYLTDDQGIALATRSYLKDAVTRADGYELLYVSVQPVDTLRIDHLDLHLDLTIGPCGHYPGVYEDSQPTPTPVPLIANYHLSFSVPVYPGVTIQPDQIVESGGIQMRLESVTFTPSYTVAHLCYQQPAPPTLADGSVGEEWHPEDLQIQIDQGDPQQVDGGLQSNLSTDSSNETCFDAGFAEAVNTKSDVTLTVTHLVSTTSLSTLIESPSLQEELAKNLAKDGITISFQPQNSESRGYWQIVHKPAAMTDAEVDTLVHAYLTQTLETVWQFQVKR